jgi:hypothetical protein
MKRADTYNRLPQGLSDAAFKRLAEKQGSSRTAHQIWSIHRDADDNMYVEASGDEEPEEKVEELFGKHPDAT